MTTTTKTTTTKWHTDPNITEYTCYVDGGCTNNGKCNASAYGSYKIFKNDNKEDLVHEDCLFGLGGLGRVGRATNNMAEGVSINKLLTYLLSSDLVSEEDIKIVINSDSELLINQIKGIYKTKKANMKQIAKDRQQILEKIKKCTGKDPWRLFSFNKISRNRIVAVLGH